MSDSKRQSIMMIGIGMILLSIVIMYFAFSQPKVLVTAEKSSTAVSQSAVSSSLSVKTSQVSQKAVSSSSSNSYEYETEKKNSTVRSEVNFPININTCTAQDLTSIKGIGETKAQSIIEYREYLGSYTSVDQIKNISGIGESTFEKIAPYLTV